MSTTTSALPTLPEPTYTAPIVPSGATLMMKLLARLSPAGKLMVELVGLPLAVGPRYMWPRTEGDTTVTFPTMASMPEDGNPEMPAILILRGCPETNWPERPVPIRVSTKRLGLYGT